MKKLPLLSVHEKTAAELGDFAGWRTVITFTSLREEHHAVRNEAAIFDISHMTRTKITGPGATTFLQKVLTIDVERLKAGRMKYGLMLNDSGGIIDDVTVFKVENDSYIMVSNAATRDKVLEWMKAHAVENVHIQDFTESSAFFAVQGPRAHEHVSKIIGHVHGLKWFEGCFAFFEGCQVLVTRSGYTGGDGFEIILPCGGLEFFEKIWRTFVEGGAKPAGLACRDVCRIEAGFPLSGQDFDEKVTPFEANLAWAIKTDKPFFIGKQSLSDKSQSTRTLAMIELEELGVPRRGYKVYRETSEVGFVSSGCLSPLVGRGIALAYIPPDLRVEGMKLYVDVRGKLRRSVVRARPWVELPRS
ncbi:MAG: glycine cleavage system aminomethyltransferase GcvT [Candidatus Caldarchaeum sp.]|nr:glycine cleavage system aminomethyltransferase GcvT [Candidatus Caldarchaeum sp.]